jgi:hypothetical protein
MKNLYSLLPLLAILSACTTNEHLSPSKNSRVDSLIKPSKTKENGFLQKGIDSWLKNDSTSNVKKNEPLKTVNEVQNHDFTLQKYVDKAAAYLKEDNNTDKDSLIERTNTMPVIGKKRK